MTTPSSSAPKPRRDPRRTVTSAKVATLIGSAVGFGAVAGLVLLNPVGTTAAPASGTTNANAAPAAPAATQQPVQTTASDFFSPPPGFVDQPPILSQGSGGQDGFGSNQGSQGGFSSNQGGFGSQGGFPSNQGFGQMPGMRTGGS